jgi:hypothetical protein
LNTCSAGRPILAATASALSLPGEQERSRHRAGGADADQSTAPIAPRHLVSQRKEYVINLPTFDLIDTVIGVGNAHGGEGDKFEEFGLTPIRASKVGAPLIAECYAKFECRLVEGSRIN